ncbi:LamG domain-containing protein [Sandaracinomonas limnophila]|uniref:LamG domain-containing protein n=1 Tax=Sandaracinomonas limnophila TaxID=1862386 RepID=A0A437PR86_9BACT|nr:LamG-like jellyroll fold domain-containing protein [Sandaracinomonas limnophila]RVU24774.1 LamG domain-containing protein [Sandaracinomonas limnophila]
MQKTKLTAKFFASLLVGTMLFTSCKKSEDTLPTIDGYNNSDEVAASNLMAHWGFEDSGKETKSGATPTETKNASYATGVKGKALSLASGFLAYNAIANLNSLASATISGWVNISNNGNTPSCFLTLTRPNEWAGNLNLMAETGWKKSTNDTLVVKGLLVTKKTAGDSWQDTRNEPSKGGVQANKVAGKGFFHLVMTYDAATANFKMYVNGVKVSNPEWELRDGGNLGALAFATPTKPVIGAWGSNVSGQTSETWQAPMTGLIDELRVYNKALTEGEILSLFKLETAGR